MKPQSAFILHPSALCLLAPPTAYSFPSDYNRLAVTDTASPSTGRIDVHSHLLPGVDDGCKTIADSLECARRLVAAGYTHSFCTPHIWPDLPHNTIEQITRRVADLQAVLDENAVPLKLFPGGELNLRPETPATAAAEIVTYGMARKYCLFDIWCDELPGFFKAVVNWLQSHGVTVVMAHPERLKAVQNDPGLIRYFKDELGLLLQGNLQCLGDPVGTPTRTLAEDFLARGEYFLLGTDLHNPQTLDLRLRGLRRAIEAVGEAEVDRLTVEHPRLILGEALSD
jgi:protein-tyrosine phosphatase